jgi:hypothetical protein
MALELSTKVPFGNACDVSLEKREGMMEVSFAADPHGGPESLWFCFRLQRSKAGKKTGAPVRLVLKHSENMLGMGQALRTRPVARYDGGEWERLEAPSLEALPDGRQLVVWQIARPQTFVDIAFCYPYGKPELDSMLADTENCWKADVIGVSQGARPLVRLSNDYGLPEGERPGIYVVARQHSGETTGSWVLDGFLREMARLGEAAPLVWAVPFTNIDGVEQGDYGKDNFPYDLNRSWGVTPMRHETLVYQRDVARWKRRCRPMLGIDFHSPGGTETTGVYVFAQKPDHAPEAHKRCLAWTSAVEEKLKPEYAAEDFCRIARYPSRWELPNFTSFCGMAHDLCAFSVETAYSFSGDLLLTIENYREIGQRIAQGVVEQVQRALAEPPTPPPAPAVKKRATTKRSKG